MTDDEKLKRLDELELSVWDSLDVGWSGDDLKAHDQELTTDLEIIERCQRIRANIVLGMPQHTEFVKVSGWSE